jgi:hypothetical protein
MANEAKPRELWVLESRPSMQLPRSIHATNARERWDAAEALRETPRWVFGEDAAKDLGPLTNGASER